MSALGRPAGAVERTAVTRRAWLLAAVPAAGGCSMTPKAREMRTRNTGPARPRPLPGAVVLVIAGERDRAVQDGPWIPPDDFKAALEASLTEARVFERIGTGTDARYVLAGNVTRLERPMFAINAEVTVDVAWSLADRADGGRLLLRKVLTATGRATLADSVGGVGRARMALEAVARHSIDALIAELAALPG